MSASNALENRLLDHIFGVAAYTPLTTVYIALYTADPGEAGSANTSEATGTGYARVAVDNDDTTWEAAAAGVTANAIDIDFPTPGSGGWGGGNDITHFGIVATASGAGEILFSGALAVAKAINEGDAVTFPAGSLTVSAN